MLGPDRHGADLQCHCLVVAALVLIQQGEVVEAVGNLRMVRTSATTRTPNITTPPFEARSTE